MSPHPDHPGPVSTGIDIAIVVVVLGCGGVLGWSAYQGIARGVRAAHRWRRRRRAWLRGPKDGGGS